MMFLSSAITSVILIPGLLLYCVNTTIKKYYFSCFENPFKYSAL